MSALILIAFVCVAAVGAAPLFRRRLLRDRAAWELQEARRLAALRLERQAEAFAALAAGFRQLNQAVQLAGVGMSKFAAELNRAMGRVGVAARPMIDRLPR